MATDQEDVLMSSASATQPIETSTPNQNSGDHSGTPDGERAAKRLKTDGSAPTLTESSGSVPEANGSVPTNPLSDGKPLPEQNGSGVVAAIEAEAKNNDGEGSAPTATAPEPRKGVAPIKKEFLINASKPRVDQRDQVDDDAAEARSDQVQKGQGRDKDKGKKEKRSKGQNTERSFGQFGDTIRLCHTRAHFPEFSPQECRFGDGCKQSHDLRKYLAEGRRGDLEIFDGMCPVFTKFGKCSTGWKCRFVKSHMREVEHEDGRKELVLVDNTVEEGRNDATDAGKEEDLDARKDQRYGVFNTIDGDIKYNLSRKKVDFTKADQYIQWTDQEAKVNHAFNHRRGQPGEADVDDLRAQFVDPPFKASEKRRLYFGPETPALAPLTTQGNLPFRRLCVELGAQLTYSEMAVGLPLVQGATSDWTLFKAHESEMLPPRVKPATNVSGTNNLVFDGYDNARDIRFGAQISANLPWVAIKAADALNRFCPHLRLIDLNCGCPIDMIFKSGGGSALLDAGPKLERMIRGMNAMSGETPITAKIRTGVKSNRPTAQQIIGRLAFGAREHRARLGAPGCAAITLHGRSREQRYTRTADWGFIGECAALVKTYNEQKDALTDTAAEPDPSTLPNTKDGKMFFLGNGDCYSHVDYQEHIENARVDSIMIGRGALIKPWIFEEIEKGQYLDKSASERLTYIEKFVRYGLEAWGSDELGIGFTRRFLCEWLSFTHRYVPIGLLERLPPSLNDRPPAYQGRNDLETLMASTNYKDWVKISEMFLGPSQPGFKFQPKHKSNAYEAEG